MPPDLVAAIARASAHLADGPLIAALFHRELRYVWDAWYWLAWDGLRWVRVSDSELLRFAVDAARFLAEQGPDEAARAHGRELLASDRRLSWAMDLAAVDDALRTHSMALDRKPGLLNCCNGTLDLETGELRAHDRDAMITQVSHAAFDPEAVAPAFQRALLHALGSAERVAFLQRAVGGALCGGRRSRGITWLCGSQAGTILEAISVALGDYAAATRPELFWPPRSVSGFVAAALAELGSARFVTCHKLGRDVGVHCEAVKFLAGELNSFPGRSYGRKRGFRPGFGLFVEADAPPRIHGPLLWLKVPIRTLSLARIAAYDREAFRGGPLLAESAGVLAWCARGARAWLAEGSGVLPAYGPLAAFLESCCVLETGPSELAERAYGSYLCFCAETNQPASDRQRFLAMLEDHHGLPMSRGRRDSRGRQPLAVDNFRLLPRPFGE